MYPGNWKMDSGKLGKVRSPELKAVDTALATFDGARSKANLNALVDAILDWQGSKTEGPWSASIRRVAMVKLINYAKNEAQQLAPGVGRRIFNRRFSKRARARLLQDPDSFLTKNRLAIAGADDGPATFYLYLDTPDHLFLDQLLDDTYVPYPANCYKLDTAETWGAQVPAVSIKMHSDINDQSTAADVAGKLYAVGAANVMVTGMLTACTFVIRNQGGLRCTHIQPWVGPGGRDGDALQDKIAGMALPQTTVYGKRDYTMYYTHVIGINSGGWTVYAQRSDLGRNVVGLDQIYPQRMAVPLA